MRATAHCANHPSREAEIRCADCGKWVCERCVTEHRNRIFCSSACRWKFASRGTTTRLASILGQSIEPAWSITVVTVACILLVLAVGRLVADLMEAWAPSDSGIVEVAVPVAPHPITGSYVRDGERWMLEITGEPGGMVLVEVDGRPSVIVELDRDGRAVVDQGVAHSTEPSIRLRGLGSGETEIMVPATATPTATPTLTATATSTATASATPTTTATPSHIASPLPSASPAATKIATRVRQRTATPTPAQARTRQPTPSPTSTARPAIDRERGTTINAPPVLHLVADAGSRLALTFDGAMSANGTHDLLDMLQQLDLRVTIFVTGKFVERFPAVVRRAVLAGHEVGNHSYSHPRLTSYATNRRHDLLPNVTKTWFLDELRRTETAFRDATGRPMAPLWRAPYGEENRTLRGWAMELGYLHIRWSSLQGQSLDSLDWVEDEHSSLYFDASRLVDRLLTFPKMEGGIVLMHLSSDRDVPPWSELPRFTREVQRRGVQVTSVSEVLQHSKTWKPWLDRAAERHREVFPANDAR